MKALSIYTIAGLAGAFLLVQPSLTAAEPETRGSLSESDYKFVNAASQGGTAEVKLGELAKQKGTSQAVKEFGERMVTDHGKANQELTTIAAGKNAVPRSEFTHKENSTFEKLQKASGKDFDKAYAAAMVKDHKEDVKEFKEAAQDLKDPELRAFAAKTLPVLEEHLKMAQDMESAVKKE